MHASISRRPGDRLTQLIWIMALAGGERLPLPTVERVNELKRLVASWQDGDDTLEQVENE